MITKPFHFPNCIIQSKGVVTLLGPTNFFLVAFFSVAKTQDGQVSDHHWCRTTIIGAAMPTLRAPQCSTAPPLSPPASSSDESSKDKVNVVPPEDEVNVDPPKRRATWGSALQNNTNKKNKTTVEKSTKTRTKTRMSTKKLESLSRIIQITVSEISIY